MKLDFSDPLYDLRRAHDLADGALHDARKWQDNVSRSYGRFIDETAFLISQIENGCRTAEGKAGSASNINLTKHESELSSFEARLRRI